MTKIVFLSLMLLRLAVVVGAGEESFSSRPTVATFSIIAIDPKTGEIGVAVQSRIVGVGGIVPFAKAGVGAIATQAYANVNFGPVGLSMLEEKIHPDEVIRRLVETDSDKVHRQVAVLAAKDGAVAQFTGESCFPWAGGKTGEGYSVQGNILVDESVVEAMAAAFEKSKAMVLSERLLLALEAGQEAGGDRRGKQSAALLVVRKGWGYGGQNDRFRDIRVDEHDEPIKELRRVYEAHRKLFPRPVSP